MRKRIIIAIACCISFCIIGAALVWFFLCISPAEPLCSSLSVDKNADVLSTEDSEIDILVLSDIQFCNLFEMARAYSAVKKTVKTAQPDLILTTGDNFGNAVNSYHLESFVDFMDSFGVPWGVTFGNHDYNADFSMDEYCDALSEGKNSIFKSEEIAGTYSNYSYRIEMRGKDVCSIICMDTKKDGLTTEHTAWYEDRIKENECGDESYLQSFVFFHIPLPQTLSAAELYESDTSVGSGEISVGIRTHKNESGIFEKASELGSTRAFFYGHDHLNNAHIDYNGISLCYSTKSSPNVSYRKDSLGGILIKLGDDGSYSIDRVLIK